jgi:hypothetical protein
MEYIRLGLIGLKIAFVANVMKKKFATPRTSNEYVTVTFIVIYGIPAFIAVVLVSCP